MFTIYTLFESDDIVFCSQQLISFTVCETDRQTDSWTQCVLSVAMCVGCVCVMNFVHVCNTTQDCLNFHNWPKTETLCDLTPHLLK